MSKRTQSVKKAKTASAPRHRTAKHHAYVLFAAAILLALTLAHMMMSSAKRYDGPLACASHGCVELEYATTPAQMERGLSGRDGMPRDHGMLFVFKSPQRECMWMKDMRFDLDMVWLNSDKHATKIMSGVSPGSYPAVFCADDTNYVLELNRGVAETMGIRIGDSIQL